MLPFIPWGLGVVGVVCYMIMGEDNDRASDNNSLLVVMVVGAVITGLAVFSRDFTSIKFFDAHVEAVHWWAGGIMLVLGVAPLAGAAVKVLRSITAMRDDFSMRISEDE